MAILDFFFFILFYFILFYYFIFDLISYFLVFFPYFNCRFKAYFTQTKLDFLIANNKQTHSYS